MGDLVKPDDVPLYVQMRKSLQDHIANIILIPGENIPSEDELAFQFDISRMKVHQEISDLIDEGLLYRRSPSPNATKDIALRAMEKGE